MHIKKLAPMVALVGVGLAGPVAAQDAPLQDVLSGNRAPLTLKLKDLNGEWRRMTIAGPSDMGNYMQMIGAMFGGGGSGGNTHYTQGKTLTLGGETYIIAYKTQTKGLDLAAMMRMGGPMAKPPVPEKLTGESALTLTLMNLRNVLSISDIRPFNLQQELAEADKAAQDQAAALGGIGGAMIPVPGEEHAAEGHAAPAQAPSRVGKTAPSLRLADLNGKQRTLAEFRGKTVLLNFFASW